MVEWCCSACSVLVADEDSLVNGFCDCCRARGTIEPDAGGDLRTQRDAAQAKAEKNLHFWIQTENRLAEKCDEVRRLEAENVELRERWSRLAHERHVALQSGFVFRMPADETQDKKPTAEDADKKGWGAADPVIDAAIDKLATRKVTQPDRGKLRDALDKADKPVGGRDGQDAAVGRIFGRPQAPLTAMDWARRS